MTVVSGCMARRQDRHAAHGDAGRWADRRRSGSYRVGNRGAHVRGHASRLSMGADRQVPDRGALTVSVRRPCLEPGCCSYVVGAQGRSNRKTWRCDAHQKLRRAAENKARIADQIRQSVTSRPTERCRNHTGSDVPLRYRTCVLDRRRHGTPSSRCRAGGTHSMTNLQPACRPCNEAKGSSAESELKS